MWGSRILKSKQWVSLFALELQDPTPLLKYDKNKKLLGKNLFKILVNHCSGDAPSHLVRVFKANVRSGGLKFKFGVQVPLEVKQDLALDKQNGDHKWRDAIRKELIQLE